MSIKSEQPIENEKDPQRYHVVMHIASEDGSVRTTRIFHSVDNIEIEHKDKDLESSMLDFFWKEPRSDSYLDMDISFRAYPVEENHGVYYAIDHQSFDLWSNSIDFSLDTLLKVLTPEDRYRFAKTYVQKHDDIQEFVEQHKEFLTKHTQEIVNEIQRLQEGSK